MRDRLAALYGAEANAELSASEETAEVVLTMPLGGVEATPTPASGAAATGAAAGRAAS